MGKAVTSPVMSKLTIALLAALFFIILADVSAEQSVETDIFAEVLNDHNLAKREAEAEENKKKKRNGGKKKKCKKGKKGKKCRNAKRKLIKGKKGKKTSGRNNDRSWEKTKKEE